MLQLPRMNILSRLYNVCLHVVWIELLSRLVRGLNASGGSRGPIARGSQDHRANDPRQQEQTGPNQRNGEPATREAEKHQEMLRLLEDEHATQKQQAGHEIDVLRRQVCQLQLHVEAYDVLEAANGKLRVV
ncbi:hypothetical protein GQ600_25743 [Phytophthora cactorum]|nr:hypothetical protein GQ600_25743 [Phytophthora cactorum]